MAGNTEAIADAILLLSNANNNPTLTPDFSSGVIDTTDTFSVISNAILHTLSGTGEKVILLEKDNLGMKYIKIPDENRFNLNDPGTWGTVTNKQFDYNMLGKNSQFLSVTNSTPIHLKGLNELVFASNLITDPTVLTLMNYNTIKSVGMGFLSDSMNLLTEDVCSIFDGLLYLNNILDMLRAINWFKCISLSMPRISVSMRDVVVGQNLFSKINSMKSLGNVPDIFNAITRLSNGDFHMDTSSLGGMASTCRLMIHILNNLGDSMKNFMNMILSLKNIDIADIMNMFADKLKIDFSFELELCLGKVDLSLGVTSPQVNKLLDYVKKNPAFGETLGDDPLSKSIKDKAKEALAEMEASGNNSNNTNNDLADLVEEIINPTDTTNIPDIDIIVDTNPINVLEELANEILNNKDK